MFFTCALRIFAFSCSSSAGMFHSDDNRIDVCASFRTVLNIAALSGWVYVKNDSERNEWVLSFSIFFFADARAMHKLLWMVV